MRNKAYTYALLIGIFPFMANGYINHKISQNLALYWSFELFSWLILPTAIFAYLFKYHGLKWQDLGIHRLVNDSNNIFYLAFSCMLFMMLSYPLYQLCVSISHLMVGQTPSLFSYESMQPSSRLLKWLTACYYAISAGVVEELYYRGLLYKITRQFKQANLWFILCSPLLFSLSHWEQGLNGLIETYLFGLVFGFCYLLIKNLWPLIAGHVITDVIWFS